MEGVKTYRFIVLCDRETFCDAEYCNLVEVDANVWDEIGPDEIKYFAQDYPEAVLKTTAIKDLLNDKGES